MLRVTNYYLVCNIIVVCGYTVGYVQVFCCRLQLRAERVPATEDVRYRVPHAEVCVYFSLRPLQVVFAPSDHHK